MDHDYTKSPVIDCIVYYVTGSVSRKLIERSRDTCKAALTPAEALSYLNQAELVNIKTRGGLIHANSNLYNLFHTTETIFAHHIESKRLDIYVATIFDVMDTYKFSFPCEFHKEKIMSYCLHYYTTMKIRQWAKIESHDTLKQSREKKKIGKANQKLKI